jgi:hypothetical protein
LVADVHLTLIGRLNFFGSIADLKLL